MKHTERGELKKLSQVHQRYSFTGLIYPEWCLTPLKAHILPLHLNPSWIFRSRTHLRISQVPPLGWGWRGKKQRMKRGKEEEDVGLSPSHAYVSVLVCWGTVSPFHPPNQTPPSLHPTMPVQSQAQEAYSVRHIDKVSGEAATGTRITWIMNQRLQGWLGTEIRVLRR